LAGERTIPSINRERSVQSRVSSALALLVVVLVGGGFLVWYYSTAFQKQREAQTESRRKIDARAAGEMKLPPLGAVAPPTEAAVAVAGPDRPSAIGDVLGPRTAFAAGSCHRVNHDRLVARLKRHVPDRALPRGKKTTLAFARLAALHIRR